MQPGATHSTRARCETLQSPPWQRIRTNKISMLRRPSMSLFRFRRSRGCEISRSKQREICDRIERRRSAALSNAVRNSVDTCSTEGPRREKRRTAYSFLDRCWTVPPGRQVQSNGSMSTSFFPTT